VLDPHAVVLDDIHALRARSLQRRQHHAFLHALLLHRLAAVNRLNFDLLDRVKTAIVAIPTFVHFTKRAIAEHLQLFVAAMVAVVEHDAFLLLAVHTHVDALVLIEVLVQQRNLQIFARNVFRFVVVVVHIVVVRTVVSLLLVKRFVIPCISASIYFRFRMVEDPVVHHVDLRQGRRTAIMLHWRQVRALCVHVAVGR